jgi:hypothetical protein
LQACKATFQFGGPGRSHYVSSDNDVYFSDADTSSHLTRITAIK